MTAVGTVGLSRPRVQPPTPQRQSPARPKGARGKSKLDGKEEEIRLLLQKQVSKASICRSSSSFSRLSQNVPHVAKRRPGGNAVSPAIERRKFRF